MAKWGEGDPRWIVEERPDATNVNNWHWTEKNATEWSKQRLKHLFEGLVVDDKVGRCEITSLVDATGEAFANNRKSKLIFFYEWQLELDWSGRVGGDDTVYEGKVKIANFSEEYIIKEVDVEISVKGSSNVDEQLKAMMKSKGVPLIKKKLETYLKELKEEYSKDLILPTKSSDSAAATQNSTTAKNQGTLRTGGTGDNKNSATGVQIPTDDLHLSEQFHCSAEDFYRALTIPEMVAAFTRSPNLLYQPEKGGKFVMFNGMVTGEFVDLVKNEKIVQKWRFKSWPDEHYSTVTLKLKQDESGTRVTMDQTQIPQNDFNRTKEGWKNYYWDSLKATFGFGALLT